MLKVQFGIANLIRSGGQALDRLGRQLEISPYVENVQPCTRIVKLKSDVPKVDGVFIAQSANVIGKVDISATSSVWYGAVIRGDLNSVRIGTGTSVGDRTMIHSDSKGPATIGSGVVIGAGSILHGCIVEDSCLIGEGSQVLDGAKIGRLCIISPGSLVPMGKEVPSGQLWAGIPAKYQREITTAEAAGIVALALENSKLAEEHAQESAKSWQTIEDEEFDYWQQADRNPFYFRRLGPEALSKKLGEIENHQVPGRILDSPISSRYSPDARPKDV